MATAPDNFPDMVEEVWTKFANRLRGVPAPFVHTDEDNVSEDEPAAPTRRKQGLKSGNVQTADTLVTRKITWPHEVVYTSQGQLAVYDDMSVAL